MIRLGTPVLTRKRHVQAGGDHKVHQVLLAGSVPTTPERVDVNLAEGAARTVNLGQVVSAHLKVAMTASVKGKAIIKDPGRDRLTPPR